MNDVLRNRRDHDEGNYGSAKESNSDLFSECRNLVETMVRSLVDDRDALEVSVVSGGRTIVFSVKCDQGDVGKLIGKEGRTAMAMRHVLSHAAAKYDRRAMLEIIEPA